MISNPWSTTGMDIFKFGIFSHFFCIFSFYCFVLPLFWSFKHNTIQKHTIWRITWYFKFWPISGGFRSICTKRHCLPPLCYRCYSFHKNIDQSKLTTRKSLFDVNEKFFVHIFFKDHQLSVSWSQLVFYRCSYQMRTSGRWSASEFSASTMRHYNMQHMIIR